MQRGASGLFKAANKDTIKIQYQIKIGKLEGLPKTTTGSVFVSWKRGKKSENHGDSNKIPVSNGSAVFDQSFTLDASLVKDKKGVYQSKKIKFTVSEEKEEKKGKKHVSSISSFEVDLAHYAEAKTERSKPFPINEKSKSSPMLTISFQATLLKMNGKTVVKANDPNHKEILEQLGKKAVQLDGQEYFLQTETDHSDPDETDLNPTSEHDSDGEEEVSFEEDTVTSTSGVSTLKPSDAATLSRRESNLSSSDSAGSLTPRQSIPATPATSTTTTTTAATAPSPSPIPIITTTTITPIATPTKESKGDVSADAKLKKYKKKVKSLKGDLAKVTKERDDKVEELKKAAAVKPQPQQQQPDNSKEIEQLHMQIDRLEKDKKAVEDNLEMEKNQNAKGMNDLTMLQEQILTLKSNVEREQGEKKTLESRVHELETAAEQATAQHDAAKQQHDDEAKAAISKLEEELTAAKQSADRLQDEGRSTFLLLEEERLKSNALSGEVTRQNQDISNFEEQIKHLEKQLLVNAEEVGKFNSQEADYLALRDKVKDIEVERQQSVDQCESLKKEVNDLTEKLSELNDTQARRQTETNAAEDEVELLNQRLEVQKDEIAKLATEHANREKELQSQIDELSTKSANEQSEAESRHKEELTEMSEQNRKLKNENEEMEKSIETLNMKLNNASSEQTGELSELNERIEVLTEELETSKRQKDKYFEELNTIKDKNDELEVDYATLKEDLERRKQQDLQSDKDQTIEDQAARIQELKKKVELLQQETVIYKEEIDGFKEQIEDYKKDTSKKEEVVHDYQSLMEQLQKNVDALTIERDATEEKLSQATDTIASLEEQLEAANDKSEKHHDSDSDEEDVEELKAKIDKYKEKIRDLKEELESKDDEHIEEKVKLEESVQSLEQENKDLSEKLQAATAAAATATAAAAAAAAVVAPTSPVINTGELDNLKEQVKILKNERDSERKSNIDLKEQIDTVGHKYSELIKDSDQLKQQLQQAKAEAAEAVAAASSVAVAATVTPSSPKLNGVDDSTRKDLEDLRNIESCIYWPELDFDRNNVPYCGASVWQMIDSIGGVSNVDNHKMLSKIVHALEKSFLRSGSDCKVICYWFSTVVHILQKLHQNALCPQSADPTISGIEIYVSSFAAPSTESGGSFVRDLQSLVLNIYGKLISIIESKIEKILIPSIFSPDSIILDQKSLHKTTMGTTKSNAITINNLFMILDSILFFLDEGKVCQKLSNQLLNQTFYFINAQITNHFLQTQSVCRATMGFKVKMGVSRLKEWCSQTSFKTVSEQLDSSLEVSNLFVIDKAVFVDIEAIKPIFQRLNLAQIKKLLESFEPDDLSPDPLPSQLQKAMNGYVWKQQAESSNLPLLIDPSKKLKA
ncbi:hypothetical protein SAMD00019534_065870 [Acytostelium subglobosum LB1]|uniref:hypothetical protein n=1 Tax=Acytostelium subglobosum LB1 TaxID=1410327 RepID=UPI000644D5A9|nr:hypothetical protein SAMD00019534_065870 [Acytostelium subglobosum LB1]GAM23412.1 hypothetical protein SAMD00019534_065870 [Acytostelium subglobosum LB1]|eukprot:XP_012753861.1 hypothetical protein SAMD00019534_065870 [Acytostelium subglobosum LB1]